MHLGNATLVFGIVLAVVGVGMFLGRSRLVRQTKEILHFYRLDSLPINSPKILSRMVAVFCGLLLIVGLGLTTLSLVLGS